MLLPNRPHHLDNHVQFVEITQCQTATYFIERQHLLCTQALFALQLFALIGNFTSFLLRFYYVECITGSRSAIQAQYQSWLGRTCLLDALVAFVEYRFYPP